MSDNSLSNLPTQYVRNVVKETLKGEKSLDFDDLSEQVFETLLEETEPTNEDIIIFENVLSALVESERVHYLHGHYTLNEEFVDNLEEELYSLPNSHSQHLNIDGGLKPVYSVGSERYNVWDSFDIGQEVNVVLLAEPENKFDTNAIAICLEDSPIAYLARSEAKLYKPVIDKLSDMGVSLELTGIVSENPLMEGYRYFELAPLEPEEIEPLL